MSIISKFNKSVNENKGRSLSLPAQGRAGARATSSLAAHFAKRNAKFGGGGKAKAGKNSFPPTPFLFARPSENYQKSASGFSRKKVRILTKRYRQFSDRDFWAIVASPRQRRGSASARILNGFLKSKNNFCPLKRKFGLPKANINLKNLLTDFFLSPKAKSKAII